MIYFRKKKKKILIKLVAFFVLLLILILGAVRFLNLRLDPLVCDSVEEGLKNTITALINEAVYETITEGDYGSFTNISYSSGGKIGSLTVDTFKVNLLRADAVARISAKLLALEKYYVYIDISNVLDDVILLGNSTYQFGADVVPIGGVEADIVSDFSSAGINQTCFSLGIDFDVGITAIMLISTATIDVSAYVPISQTLIVGDVPSVYWG